MKSSSILVIAIVITITATTSGLKCYSCSQSGTDTDHRCVENPKAVTSGSPTVNCNKRYCTILRQEYKDPKGQIATFLRGCEDTPTYLNKDLDDETYKTHYRACTKNLCNNGTGTESIVGNGFGGDIGPSGIIIVKGVGSSGRQLAASFSLYIILLYILV